MIGKRRSVDLVIAARSKMGGLALGSGCFSVSLTHVLQFRYILSNLLSSLPLNTSCNGDQSQLSSTSRSGSLQFVY
jgi:hypothetical protein